MASWRHLWCLSLKPVLKSFNMSSFSSFGSFITLRAIDSSSGLEGKVPGSLGSSLEEPETPLEVSAKLSDAEGEKIDEDPGAELGP